MKLDVLFQDINVSLHNPTKKHGANHCAMPQ